MRDKSFMAIMVGYADNHKRDTYKSYNPETKRVVMTRDVNIITSEPEDKRIPDE